MFVDIEIEHYENAAITLETQRQTFVIWFTKTFKLFLVLYGSF